MAPKAINLTKKSKRGREEKSFDRTWLVSEYADRRYEDYASRKGIPERGLIVTKMQWPNMHFQIEAMHWHKFCKKPHPSILSIVREFYLNSVEHSHRFSMVRGQDVLWSSSTINAYFYFSQH